jgi:hypothetical protein
MSGKKATEAGAAASLLLPLPSFSCSSKLIIGTIRSSETSSCLRTTWHYIPESHTYTTVPAVPSTEAAQSVGWRSALPSRVTWSASCAVARNRECEGKLITYFTMLYQLLELYSEGCGRAITNERRGHVIT